MNGGRSRNNDDQNSTIETDSSAWNDDGRMQIEAKRRFDDFLSGTNFVEMDARAFGSPKQGSIVEAATIVGETVRACCFRNFAHGQRMNWTI